MRPAGALPSTQHIDARRVAGAVPSERPKRTMRDMGYRILVVTNFSTLERELGVIIIIKKKGVGRNRNIQEYEEQKGEKYMMK